MHLIGRMDSCFYEVPEGLIYFTYIVPRYRAQFHVVFFDGKLRKDRIPLCVAAMQECVDDFDIRVFQTELAAGNVPLREFVKKLGFVWEGTQRRGWVDETGISDKLLFGILSEEIDGSR